MPLLAETEPGNIVGVCAVVVFFSISKQGNPGTAGKHADMNVIALRRVFIFSLKAILHKRFISTHLEELLK